MNPVSTIRKEYLLDEMSQFVSFKSEVIQRARFYKKSSRWIECAEARCSNENGYGGMGIDIDVSTAMVKSLAEALERYTIQYARANGIFLYKKSMREMQSLGHLCFCSDYDIYEDYVYKNHPYLKKMTPDLKTDWVACRRFSDNKQAWLPASYIFHYHQNIWTTLLKKISTNGASCSFFDSAVEDAILELLERDTFLYMWFAKKSGEEILFDKVHYPPLKELLSRIDYRREQIKVIYKYTDTQIPCMFVLFKGRGKYNDPAFHITGSADTHIERGCYRALLEFVAVYNNNENYKIPGEKIKREKNFIIKKFRDRIAYYTLYDNFEKCEFLFDVRGTKKLSELSRKWSIDCKEETLRRSLKDKRIFFADVTPKEISKTSARIVKSYSPDLLDLDIEEDCPFNFSFKRKRVDLVDKFFNEKTKTLNKEPHCYP